MRHGYHLFDYQLGVLVQKLATKEAVATCEMSDSDSFLVVKLKGGKFLVNSVLGLLFAFHTVIGGYVFISFWACFDFYVVVVRLYLSCTFVLDFCFYSFSLGNISSVIHWIVFQQRVSFVHALCTFLPTLPHRLLLEKFTVLVIMLPGLFILTASIV